MAYPKQISTMAGNNENGFAVLEGLIATAIFALMMTALALLLSGSMKANANARSTTEESAIAADRVESLFPLDYDEGELAAGDHDLGDDEGYTVSYAIGEDTVLRNTKHIQVTVQSAKNGIKKTVTIDHIKANTP